MTEPKNLQEQNFTLNEVLDSAGNHKRTPRFIGRLMLGYGDLLKRIEGSSINRKQHINNWSDRVTKKSETLANNSISNANASLGAFHAENDAQKIIENASKDIALEQQSVVRDAENIVNAEAEHLNQASPSEVSPKPE